MAEIKVEDGFRVELDEFAASAEALKAYVSLPTNVPNLPAAKAFHQLLAKMNGVFVEYIKLVNKDADELIEFVDKMKELDNA